MSVYTFKNNNNTIKMYRYLKQNYKGNIKSRKQNYNKNVNK